ncbi:hypothetical protein [Vibrio taketomensis]|uniref:hypothetical protein n=1 Tax=Vibrio taketomensis TaxID=2572923 RepID=UPI0013899838|nr:hypothetical protein [Vibrio taketomensis]
MSKNLLMLTVILTVAGCSTQKHQLPKDHVRFVIGNPLTTYEVNLSIGSYDEGGFKEGSFSQPSYTLTEDQRYIVGNAKRGSVIAITSTKATDAGGNYLGKFTPCNKTLVFQLPSGYSTVYVTDINYEWGKIVIYPKYRDNYDQAKAYFSERPEWGIQELAQTTYRQLYAELYSGCRKTSSHPYALWRPY